jgi:hypothetical protein
MKQFLRLIHIVINIEKTLSGILSQMERINPPEKEEEIWMDSFEVRSLFKIHRSTLYRWKTEKWLRARRVGRKDMYLKSDIENLLRGNRVAAIAADHPA